MSIACAISECIADVKSKYGVGGVCFFCFSLYSHPDEDLYLIGSLTEVHPARNMKEKKHLVRYSLKIVLNPSSWWHAWNSQLCVCVCVWGNTPRHNRGHGIMYSQVCTRENWAALEDREKTRLSTFIQFHSKKSILGVFVMKTQSCLYRTARRHVCAWFNEGLRMRRELLSLQKNHQYVRKCLFKIFIGQHYSVSRIHIAVIRKEFDRIPISGFHPNVKLCVP